MAHYVPIPKDLNEIKEKFIAGFTKRQVICFGIGLVIGAPVFFLTRNAIGMSGAIFAMGACAAPAILCGLYRKNGVFLEKQIRFMKEYFTRPRKRYYRTTNVFVSFERHIEYMKITVMGLLRENIKIFRKYRYLQLAESRVEAELDHIEEAIESDGKTLKKRDDSKFVSGVTELFAMRDTLFSKARELLAMSIGSPAATEKILNSKPVYCTSKYYEYISKYLIDNPALRVEFENDEKSNTTASTSSNSNVSIFEKEDIHHEEKESAYPLRFANERVYENKQTIGFSYIHPNTYMVYILSNCHLYLKTIIFRFKVICKPIERVIKVGSAVEYIVCIVNFHSKLGYNS